MNIAPISFRQINPVGFKALWLNHQQENIFDYYDLDDVEITTPYQKGCIIIDNSKIYNRNKTFFLRDDIEWENLGEYLKKRYKDDKKINVYDYGCSSGVEPYSISILIQVTQEKPNRFFPIMAKDINEDTIRKAQATKETKGFLLDNYNEDYRLKDTLNLSDKEIKKFLKVVDSPYGHISYIKDKTLDTVNYSCANILEDIENIDSKNPSIVICRNMWPYIDYNEYDEYCTKLYEKLAPKSIVIIGMFDVGKNGYLVKGKKTIQDSLIDAGFTPKNISNVRANVFYLVYEKN